MKLHEYQAKQLLAEQGIPIAPGFVCTSVEQTIEAINKLGGQEWVAKCQVHAGGRGRAGGIQRIQNLQELIDFTSKWFGHNLVTGQTDSTGQPVNHILVERYIPFVQELYLSALIDPQQEKVIVIGSAHGGVDIETIMRQNPQLVYQETINPFIGTQQLQGHRLADKLGLHGEHLEKFNKLFIQLMYYFLSNDLSFIEINPLIITKDNRLCCLDVKMIVDDNALFRQPKMQKLRDLHQENSYEIQATDKYLTYVALRGNIGCMVNGAGLAMATMDMLHYYNGKPANFLDVGGSATKERVAAALRLLLSDPQVTVILINIFGGIVCCETVAEGIVMELNNLSVTIPIIVRLQGNRAIQANEKLLTSTHQIATIAQLEVAVRQAVMIGNNVYSH